MMSNLETANNMSNIQKWIIIQRSIVLLATLAAIILWGTGCQPGNSIGKPSEICNLVNGSNPIPRDSIISRLVPTESAAEDVARFQKLIDSLKYLKYNGVIIRNTDVLLSLGLNNLDLLKYTYCEQIRLRTIIGISPDKQIRVFVHPVQIVTKNKKTTFINLSFNNQGIICDSTGKHWDNPCKDCNGMTVEKTENQEPKLKVIAASKSGTYVLDLNNPCPPCM